jgi:hypothetical protein
MNEERQSRTSLLGEGFLLVLLSALSYLLAFYYEKGYSSHFGIPDEFISVEPVTMLLFAAAVIGLILLAFPLVNLAVMVFPTKLHAAVKLSMLKLAVLSFVFLLVPIASYGIRNWRQWAWYLAIISFAVVFEFVFPLLTHRSVKGYGNKLAACAESDKSRPDFFSIFQGRGRWNPVVLLFAVLLVTHVAQQIGRAEAFRRDEFLVTNTNPPRVVVCLYGEKAICMILEGSPTATLTPVFSVVNTTDSELLFTKKKVGPFPSVQASISNPTGDSQKVCPPPESED